MTDVISGNCIADIRNGNTIAVPADDEVVDGTDKFLIPGLWDMHIHIFDYLTPAPPRENFFPLMIANGVTTVREMWTKPADVDRVNEWRKQVEQGHVLPRIVAAGTLL